MTTSARAPRLLRPALVESDARTKAVRGVDARAELDERHFPAAKRDAAGALIDTLATPHDRLWRSRLWQPMVPNGPLRVGRSGGHGPVRYRVGYEPSRRVAFRFEAPVGFDGYHWFEMLHDLAESAAPVH
jgi:hypothetical protein